MLPIFKAAFISFLLSAQLASACGPASKCRIGDRHYFIALPKGYDGQSRIPALIFAHGLQGSGLEISKNPRLRAVADKLGIAFVAVKSAGTSWSIANSPTAYKRSEKDVLAYFDAVKKDIIRRFPIDPKRIVVTGASAGGMATWALACRRSREFAAFIPMSGTFWSPEPRRCRGPATNIIHFHGSKDRTVPLQGRFVRGAQHGSVTKSLKMYGRYGRFSNPKSRNCPGLNCKVSRNRKGKILNFCLYDGGHSFRASNLESAWRMLQSAGQI